MKLNLVLIRLCDLNLQMRPSLRRFGYFSGQILTYLGQISHEMKIYLWKSSEDELRILSAWKKLLCSLLVQYCIITKITLFYHHHMNFIDLTQPKIETVPHCHLSCKQLFKTGKILLKICCFFSRINRFKLLVVASTYHHNNSKANFSQILTSCLWSDIRTR